MQHEAQVDYSEILSMTQLTGTTVTIIGDKYYCSTHYTAQNDDNGKESIRK